MSENSIIAICVAVMVCAIFGSASYVGGERARADGAAELAKAAGLLKHCKTPDDEARHGK